MDPVRWLRAYDDVALAAALGAVTTAEVLAWTAAHPGANVGVAVAGGLFSALALLIRRRSPGLMFVLTMMGLFVLFREAEGIDNDTVAPVLMFFVAIYSLGRHARGTEAWVGAGLMVVEALLFLQSDVGVGGADAGDVAFTVVFLGAPWGIGLTLRLRQEREATLNAENERLRVEQAERAARAVAEERSRIARELHDVVSHAISVTVLQARGARRCLDSDADAVRRALDAIEHTNTAALGDMRRLLAVLRDTEEASVPAERTPQPSLDDLDRLVDNVRGSGVPVVLEVHGVRRDVPPGVDLSAYRIVQEALTNVLKHSSGGGATVTLDYEDDALTVSVADDGVGTSTATGNGTGHGLLGIRERVAVIGGVVEAGPGTEGGYRIRARLPYALELS